MEKLQTVIFFVRHGQTSAQYVADPNLDDVRVLTEQGREQMEKVGEYLKAFAVSAIYASQTHRTYESAEIIKKVAEFSGEITEDKELLEIYDAKRFDEVKTAGGKFLIMLAKRHAGDHIVCVSHEDVIEQTLRGFNVTAEEAEFPCRMGQLYRLVFADDHFVECQKLNPASA